jgi:hypothetical protein
MTSSDSEPVTARVMVLELADRGRKNNRSTRIGLEATSAATITITARFRPSDASSRRSCAMNQYPAAHERKIIGPKKNKVYSPEPTIKNKKNVGYHAMAGRLRRTFARPRRSLMAKLTTSRARHERG